MDIEKNCSDVCVIAPIPKADYKVTITQTGSLNFESDIVVDNGSNLRLEYLPQRALKESTPFAFPALPDSTETYTYLTHLKNDTFVVENKIEPRSV